MFSVDELNHALAQLADQPLRSLQITTGEALASQRYPHFDPAQPVLVLGPGAPAAAAQIRQTLLQVYPPAHRAWLVRAGARQELPLAELAADCLASAGSALFIPARAGASSYSALQDVAARLRAPDGCPWDRDLTWDKLRASLLEECHELLAALDAGRADKVLEEQGDLLLQVAMQAQIAAEEGRFLLPDVITRIVDKLIRRHPHVFGDTVVNGTDEVLANWEAIKAAERAQNGEKRSPLAGVPKGLPALAQAEAYLDRMSRLRTASVPAAPWAALAALPPAARLTPEVLGSALFELVAWALAHGVEAESALRQANARFAAQVATEGWG